MKYGLAAAAALVVGRVLANEELTPQKLADDIVTKE
jgi:hypothetical protein